MAEMVKDPNCAYCMQGELVAKFAYPVCEMKTGFLYVFKEQSKKGRVILAHKKHVSELIDLTDEERNDFFAEVAQVARAVHKVFHPDVYKRQEKGRGSQKSRRSQKGRRSQEKSVFCRWG